MTALLAGLVGGAIFLGTSVTLQLVNRQRRRARLKNLELRPNCLLTRYPIVFVSGERSLFRLFDYWNDVPAYLREHGYEVMILEPSPGRARVPSIVSAVESLPEKCHLIADSSLEKDLEEIARLRPANAVSLTLVRNERARARQASRSKRFTPSELRPLERAIEVFDVSDTPLDDSRASAWQNATSFLLLHAHNLVAFGRRHTVDALEIAEPKYFGSWVLESRFLDLAISLAERDAQWCD